MCDSKYIDLCYICKATYMKQAPISKRPAAIDELETLFKALADKTRLRILSLLGNTKSASVTFTTAWA